MDSLAQALGGRSFAVVPVSLAVVGHVPHKLPHESSNIVSGATRRVMPVPVVVVGWIEVEKPEA